MASNGHNLKIKKVLLTADQIQKRVGEIARQVNTDFTGQPLHVICVLENGFQFMTDLVRSLEMPVICQFVRATSRDKVEGGTSTLEIMFTPEIDVAGQNVLLVETLVQSGVTSEFLIRNLMTRGAKSVKLAVLVDKQAERRISLQPDYFGFLMDESFVVGYGLGHEQLGRNLPYIAAVDVENK